MKSKESAVTLDAPIVLTVKTPVPAVAETTPPAERPEKVMVPLEVMPAAAAIAPDEFT